jgi:hypothetical protein
MFFSISKGNKKESIVLPNTGTRLVPEYFCLIPEQIVLKAEQIVYRFELPHSGLIASFQNRSLKD